MDSYTYDANGFLTIYLRQGWQYNQMWMWVNIERLTYTSQMLITNVREVKNVLGNYHLSNNYPNPFNPQTKISFSVSKGSFITLKVYDLLGREVVTLAQEKKQAGEYSITWNAEGMPGGVYFYRLEATNIANPKDSFVQVKKLILIK